MSTLVIRSNADTSVPVLIRDLGFPIPPAGGTETLTDDEEIAAAGESAHLDALTKDGAHVGGGDASDHSLILNDGANDITHDDLKAATGIAVMVGATPTTAGIQGLVPGSTAGAETAEFLRKDGTWAQPAGAGSGDVVGPGAANDRSIALYNGTTGKLIQNSPVTVSPAGNIATPGTVDGVDVSAHALDATAHHARYQDSEAVTAMGAAANGNTLNHNRYADSEARSAMGFVGVFTQASAPTIVQVPDGTWAFWIDTTAGKDYIVRRRAGALKQVEMH
jgi:hypothetical protein